MYKSFAEVKSALSSGESVLGIVEVYLKEIHAQEDLNAFLEVFEDSVRKHAQIVDEKRKNGTAGKLAGMVIGLKDNFCYAGHKVSAS